MLSLILFAAICIGWMVPTEAQSQSYTTLWDKPFTVICNDGYVIHHMTSVHSNWREDRQFTITCGREPKLPRFNEKDKWSGYVNDYNGVFTYQCPGKSIITGIKSVHSNWYEDRKFSFRCTTVPSYVKFGRCLWTSYVNTYDHKMDFTPDYYLKGVSSIHRNHYQDRIFKFYHCRKPGYHHDPALGKHVETIKSDAQLANELENVLKETDVADEMDNFPTTENVADELESFDTKPDVAGELKNSERKPDVADEMESSGMRMDVADEMENLETKPDVPEDMERFRNKKRESLFKKFE